MNEQTGSISFVEELQNGFTDVEVQIERAVNELELSRAALEQTLESLHQHGQGELTHRNIERREAEFAGKRTAARRFRVNHPMGHVFIRVKKIRQDQLVQLGEFGSNNFLRGRFAGQQLAANLGEFQVRFPGNHVIGQPDDLL